MINIPCFFVYIALIAWLAVFVGLINDLVSAVGRAIRHQNIEERFP
jgi:hypothetical protein